jgi:TolA-binding protein
MLEKSEVNLTKPVALGKKISTNDAASINEMQSEIEQLQSVIASLNGELEQLKNPPETQSKSFKTYLDDFFTGILSPRALLETAFDEIKDNLKSNLVGYLVSSILAGIFASGMNAMMKASSLEDIKNITQSMQAEALKEVESNIKTQSKELDQRLSSVEKANQQLTEQSQQQTAQQSVPAKEEQAIKSDAISNQPPTATESAAHNTATGDTVVHATTKK